MDAYSSYIMRLSDARLGELRREAADYRLSATARAQRRARWAAALRRLVTRRPAPPVAVTAPSAHVAQRASMARRRGTCSAPAEAANRPAGRRSVPLPGQAWASSSKPSSR